MRALVLLFAASTAHAYNIADYGAVPDCQVSSTGAIVSGTDNGPAIQAALDAWGAGGGRGTIDIPIGQWCVFTPVEKLGGTDLTISGALGGILYVYQPNTTPFHFSATQTVIRDLVIAGNQADPGGIDARHLFDFEGNITVTFDGVQIYGVNSYDPTRGGAIVSANVQQLNVYRSAFMGTVANPYGGAIVAPSLHVSDTVFQDYGNLATGFYSKTWVEQITWIECQIQSQTLQSFGAARRAGCLIEGSRFDEGAKWQIWAPSAAESLLPAGTRRQRVEVRDSAFMVPAVTQGRAINIKDTDDVDVSHVHLGIRWDEPAVSCYGCGDVRMTGISWRPLTAADGWPATPAGLKLKLLADAATRSLTTFNIGGAIVQADAPTRVISEGGLPGCGLAAAAWPWTLCLDRAGGGLKYSDGTIWMAATGAVQ